MAYGQLGFNLLDTLKQAVGAGKKASADVVLAKAGQVVADSAAGQAAIKQNLIDRAKVQGASFLDQVQPYLLPGLGILAVVYFVRRRSRR